jgi:hypothetical protein
VFVGNGEETSVRNLDDEFDVDDDDDDNDGLRVVIVVVAISPLARDMLSFCR